jgi:CubicO group peptidase (beta-lactamase class C family)
MKNLAIPVVPLLLFITYAGFGQVNETLQLKKKIQHELGPGEKHSYTVTPKADQFCLVMLQQDGADVIINAIDPTGVSIGLFDSPNGTQGPESVTFTSSMTGKYVLEVTLVDENQKKGKYSIELITLEPKGTTPEKQIDQLMSALVVPGGAGATVAVTKDAKIVFSKGYGSANPEYDIPNTPKTIFHVASVSKQFTAFSIALLADQGKISLDDDIRKYLPELNDFGHIITIRHLVHHTSGLRDQWNLLALAGWRLDDVITRSQVLRLISHQKDLNFKPGEEYSYCNTGYTLLAEIISRVSGESFEAWTSENIFKPLMMTNTFFYTDHEQIVKNRAYSFQDSESGLKKSVLSYANAGATSLFTTADDLMKWSDNFNTIKVGNAKVMKQMEERGILNKGDTLSYAFGQVIGKHKGLKSINHSGGDAGYRSYLIRFPEQKFAVAVLSNLGSFNPWSLAYKICDIYLKDQLTEEVKKKEEPAATPKVTLSEEVLKRYIGNYEIAPGLIFNIKVENGALIGQGTGQPAVTLEPKSETEFFITMAGATIIFQVETNNQVNQFTLKQAGQTIVAPRVKKVDAQANLSEFVGTYYSSELETRYTLAMEGDKLMINHIRHEPATMTYSANDVFTSTAWFMSKIEFTRNEKKEITGLKVSSGRVKDVKFEKLK